MNTHCDTNAYNYSKLRARTAELGKTGKAVAAAAGMSPSTYSLKLNGKAEFSQNEICKIITFLDISAADIGLYFFNKIVQFK